MKNVISIVTFVLLSGYTITAQQVLTLKDAVNFALKNKLEAVNAQLDLVNSEYLIEEVRANALPQINGQVGLTYNAKLQQMALDFGGDDITHFLHALLVRLAFPYKDADLSRWHDFVVLENLKERLVVLGEVS